MTNERALQASPDAHLTTGQILAGLNTVAAVLAPDLSADELRLFAMVASRSGLDPFAKQIYAVKRKGRVTFQTGIDGYRSIAARTGFYDGQDEPEYSPMCPCDETPPGHPEFCTVRVYRKGVTRAIAATAYWHEYRPQKGDYDGMWVRMPRVMIAKVAEALALRKAFPYDPEHRQGIGADIYTSDEMAQADRGPAVARQPVASLAEVARQRAAATVTGPEPATAAPTPPVPADAAEEGTFRDVDATPEPGAALGASTAGTAPLTQAQFRNLIQIEGLTNAQVVAAKDALFPDAKQLDDAMRGAVLARAIAERGDQS